MLPSGSIESMRVLIVEGEPLLIAPHRPRSWPCSYVAPGQAPAADGRFDSRIPWWHSSTVDQCHPHLVWLLRLRRLSRTGVPGLPDRLQPLPMRRREPVKTARGEVQRGREGQAPGRGPVNEPDDERRAHPGIAHIPARTSCAARSPSCPVFAGSAQNPVDVIRELRCIQRRLFPAEVESLIVGYEGGAAL